MTCALGLDIGTTSTIGILISPPDQVLAQESIPVNFSALHAGWAEEDPNEWWENVCKLVPLLADRAGVSPDGIAAVGVTGMLPATILLDSEGDILRPSIQQSDGRNSREVVELAREIDEQSFLAKTGNGITQQLIATRLRWIEKHEPAVFKNIHTVFGSYDFINWRLTGRQFVDGNWALEAGFIDLSTNELSPDLIALGHIDPKCVPEISHPGTITGEISSKASAACGLLSGTPVVGGAADHIASAFAAGIVNSGDVLLKFGGSLDILVAAKQPMPDRRMFLDYHIIPGLFMPNGCMASGGSALNWYTKNFGRHFQDEADAAGQSLHQYLDTISSPIAAGAEGVSIVPYFLGEKTPVHDANARAMIRGLSLNHDQRHLWRALLEGFGYAFRHHVEVLSEMGHPSRAYFASDGGSNSKLWVQICADILQAPIQLLEGHPGSCLGAAWLAVMGAGLSNDWNGVSAFVDHGELITPNPENADIYNEGYLRFHKLYDRTKDI